MKHTVLTGKIQQTGKKFHENLTYQITTVPAAIRRAKLDNIALVPASLLSQKGTYQPIANRLPTGSVLCVPASQRQQKIMAKVTTFFRDHGRQVITLPIERIAKKIPQPLIEFSV